ncbi:hypothetical protein PSPO01_16287 [Paraphaeosphaeria sporulosa]
MIRWVKALRIAESRRDYTVAGFEAEKVEKGIGQREGGSWRQLSRSHWPHLASVIALRHPYALKTISPPLLHVLLSHWLQSAALGLHGPLPAPATRTLLHTVQDADFSDTFDRKRDERSATRPMAYSVDVLYSLRRSAAMVTNSRQTTARTGHLETATQHKGFTTGTKASTTRTSEAAMSHGSLAAASLDRPGLLRLASPARLSAEARVHLTSPTRRTWKARWGGSCPPQNGKSRADYGTRCYIGRLERACPSPSESHLNVGLLANIPAAALADAACAGPFLLHFYCSRSSPRSDRRAAPSGPCAITPRSYSRHAHSTDWTASAPIAEHSGYFVTTKTRPIMVYGNRRYIIKAMAKVYENQATV